MALLTRAINNEAAASAYLRDLKALGEEAGLDRIPLVGTPLVVIVGYLPSGIAQAHRFLWHLDISLRGEQAVNDSPTLPPPMPRPTFAWLASFGTPVRDVELSVAGTVARWDPRAETLADARSRLRKDPNLCRETIDRELNRIADEGGYHFPDTSLRLGRDAQWTWWRIARRWTYAQIAREWERLHPGAIRLQAQADDHAREWEVRNPTSAWTLTEPRDAVAHVRKAITVFARRARVDAKTGPGRPESDTDP